MVLREVEGWRKERGLIYGWRDGLIKQWKIIVQEILRTFSALHSKGQ